MTNEKSSFSEKGMFAGQVRPLQEEDLPQIKPILETWIHDRKTHELKPEEVQEDLDLMEASIRGENDRKYFVAEEKGNVIGVVGMVQPREFMAPFTLTHNPIELVNAYVAQSDRTGRGVGTALVGKVEAQARANGNTEIVLNSGPRYQKTAWGFYDRLPGFSRVGEIPGHYGEEIPTAVWRKPLR